MQTTLEETGKHAVKLSVEVPPEEFKPDIDAAYRRIASSISIPGFRKGKVPRQVIDAQIGREAVMEEFVREALYSYYLDAVREHDLAPIGDPDLNLDDIDEAKPLTFTAEVEVRPRLALTENDYKGLKVKRPATEAIDEDIDQAVERLQDRFAELEDVSHRATDGDYVVVDLRATSGDEEIAEATRSDVLYEVGSGTFTPKLDQELPGSKKGDIHKYTDTLPDGLGGDHAGKDVSFSVLVKEVKAKKLPEADDEFAKTASEFDTMDELREDLRTRIGESKEQEADQLVRDRVLEAAVDEVDVELPDTLIDHETQHRIESAEQRAERAGVTLAQMLEIQGWDEERFRADAHDHAVRAVKADMVLESVGRAEEIEVTAEDLGKEIAALAQLSQRDPQELATQMNQTGQMNALAGDILRAKALDVMVESADITPEDPS